MIFSMVYYCPRCSLVLASVNEINSAPEDSGNPLDYRIWSCGFWLRLFDLGFGTGGVRERVLESLLEVIISGQKAEKGFFLQALLHFYVLEFIYTAANETWNPSFTRSRSRTQSFLHLGHFRDLLYLPIIGLQLKLSKKWTSHFMEK